MTSLPRNLHFIGIGGAGMSPLAAIALQAGCRVTGSDREWNAKCGELSAAGAKIHAGHHADAMPEETELAVYSSAVPAENPERQKAAALGIPQLRRGEFLAVLARSYPKLIAVSGSHGKTSITAMLVWIFCKCGRNPGWLIGGNVDGIASGNAGDGTFFLTEADESDTTHTLLSPWLGVVPNADDDHAWSVGGAEALQQNFRRFAMQSQHLLYRSDRVPDGIFDGHPHSFAPEKLEADLLPGWFGFYRENAQTALRAAEFAGISLAEGAAALADFPGACRRMTVHFSSPELVVIEDYAHHPAEVRASVAYLRERFPEEHLRILFQPHRFARLQKYLPELAQELAKADSVVIAPVFAAWSEQGPVNGADLATAIGENACYCGGSWQEIAEILLQTPRKPAVLAVIGAGDLDRVFAWLPGDNLTAK
ncbi:MAG: hypothetical protein J6R85_04030 [Lentisphaeria bacterium]|nr:hypothetical protein [Lentisphaeria bacterium]